MSKKSLYTVEIIFNVMRNMQTAVDRNMQSKDYYGEGLNKSHIRTLIMLHLQKSGTMTEIGQRVGLVKGAFSPLVDRLIQLSYVQKTISPDDRRKSILTLTPRGEVYAEQICRESADAFEANFQRLSNDERQALLQHLHSLGPLLDILNTR